MLLKSRAACSGGKGPCGHMKAILQILLPRAERMGRLRKQMRGGGEKAGAALQLLGAFLASALPERDRARLGPQSVKLAVVVCGRLGDQGADREDLGLVQEPQGPFAQPTDPAMQGGVMRMPSAQPRHGSAQRNAGKLSVAVRRATSLDHSPCVVLEGRDLYRKYTQPALAGAATAQRNRRRTMLHASVRGPSGTAIYQDRGVDQPTDGLADRANIRRTNVFALDGHAAKRIIRHGNGDGDNSFRLSRRCGCLCTRTSLSTIKPKTLRCTPHQCKHHDHGR